MMEHILQFGVSIDDDYIEKAVIKSATEACTKELMEKIFYHGSWDRELTNTAERIVKESLNDWKPEIIEAAAKIVADSIKRSKAYKEKVKEITNAV